MNELTQKKCAPCEGGTQPMSVDEIRRHQKLIHGDWRVSGDNKQIERTFEFRNYYHTTAFINAVVWIAHQEDHHPDITFGYKKATVVYSTHAIGGLSENDFICAAKIDALRDDA